ncbi:MAG: hypothetical protein R3C62_12800 [Chloroflexota bacterium]
MDFPLKRFSYTQETIADNGVGVESGGLGEGETAVCLHLETTPY